MKPRLLDLFCGAGGCSRGYQLAGFHVTGIDINPQPRYCGDEFIQMDALAIDVDWVRNNFDAVHASPPCQAYCALKHLTRKEYPDLVDRTRKLLIEIGMPYVIENVPGAPLINPVLRCGSAYGLRVKRHRLFESSFMLPGGACFHQLQGRPIDVSGTGGRRINRRMDDHGGNTNKPRNLAEGRAAMGIDWMTRKELSQAIPPAYTEQIGKHLIKAMKGAA